MVGISQLPICKNWTFLQRMEGMSSFWILSLTEPSSSAFEEVTLEESILLTHWFSTGDIVSARRHLAMSMDTFAPRVERGATGIVWVDARDAAAYPTVHRTVPTSKNDPALVSMVPDGVTWYNLCNSCP